MSELSSSAALAQNLPKDWEARLLFWKLLFGISQLDDSHEGIREQWYFFVFARTLSLSYLKEIVASHIHAQETKHTKARLFIVCDDKTPLDARAWLQSLSFPTVRVAYHLTAEQTLVMLRGATALLYPLSQVLERDLLLLCAHFGVPVVTTHHADIEDVLGHAAYFLERLDRDELERAMVKLENSPQLRSSIQHAEEELLRSARHEEL